MSCKPRSLLFALLGVTTVVFSPPARAQSVDAKEFVLDNGLKFLFVSRKGDPNISAGWVAKVGSVNERPGITGTAHLFEHMMFKGTHVIGTRDIDRDRAIIADLDRTRAAIAREKQDLELRHLLGEIDDPKDPAARSEQHKNLLTEFDSFLAAQKDVIVKDEFDKIYSSAGASGMNAGTTNDFTIYFINVPANKLELWFWMESDRLLNPIFREFYSERDVVREERRLRTESTPTGRFDEQFEAMFWAASPYSWPVIGWPSDVEAITRDEALEFFDIYYAPGNLTACVVGDFDVEHAKSLAKKYFGRIPTAKTEPTPFRTREIPQLAEKRMTAEAPTKPQVRIRYHTVPEGHRDSFALTVLQSLLNGRTGRLYKSLVAEQDIATSARASQRGLKYDGQFQLSGVAKAESTPEAVETALNALTDGLKDELVTARELQKVKNKMAADEFRKLRSNFQLLLQLLITDSYGDWKNLNTDPAKLQAVTAEDVRDVVRKYFLAENRSVLTFHTRKDESDESAGPGDEPAGLDETQLARYRQTRQGLLQMDAAAVKAKMGLIVSAANSAPPDQRAFMAAILDLFEKRLAEIDKEAKK